MKSLIFIVVTIFISINGASQINFIQVDESFDYDPKIVTKDTTCFRIGHFDGDELMDTIYAVQNKKGERGICFWFAEYPGCDPFAAGSEGLVMKYNGKNNYEFEHMTLDLPFTNWTVYPKDDILKGKIMKGQMVTAREILISTFANYKIKSETDIILLENGDNYFAVCIIDNEFVLVSIVI